MPDSRLVGTFSPTPRVNPSAFAPDITPENTPPWDSVAHLNLLLEVEGAFGVWFSSEEIPSPTSVARLQEALQRQNAL